MDAALEKSPERGCRRCNGLPAGGANLSGKRTEFILARQRSVPWESGLEPRRQSRFAQTCAPAFFVRLV